MTARTPRAVLLGTAALIEALGGLLLAALIVRLLVRAGPRPVVLVLAAALALVAGLTLLAGLWLWQGHLRGRVLSLAMQALQLPHVVTSPVVFHFDAPASVAVGLGPDGTPHAAAIWRAGLRVAWDADPDPTWIGVNLVALFVVAVVVLTWRRRTAAMPAPGPAAAG